MASHKPVIVLVHGLFHVPASYSKFTDALRANGYDVHVPQLPSSKGDRPPSGALIDDTAIIRNHVEGLVNSGHKVIVIMHSYGGQVGTNALDSFSSNYRSRKGLQGGVSHLIYMCAYVSLEGKSMVDKVREMGHEDLLRLVFNFADDGSCTVNDPKTIMVGPGSSDDEAKKYLDTFVSCNGKVMYEPIDHCAWREIPCTYVMTTEDMTIPLDYQTSMVKMMKQDGARVDTVELKTGHCPNVTMTAEMVGVVKDVAEKCHG